jgi:hypothetical protein
MRFRKMGARSRLPFRFLLVEFFSSCNALHEAICWILAQRLSGAIDKRLASADGV